MFSNIHCVYTMHLYQHTEVVSNCKNAGKNIHCITSSVILYIMEYFQKN